MRMAVLKGSSLADIKYQLLVIDDFAMVFNGWQLSAITKEVEKNPFPGIQTFLYSDTKILLYGKTWSIAAWRYRNGQ